MRVFRFMSKYEFSRYNKGENLVNTAIHTGKTNSVGFCFLNLDEYSPEEAMHFLSGIASFEICAIFETEKQLNKTYGIYAKPIKATEDMRESLFKLLLGWNDRITVNEYCTKEYNNKNFKLIRYSKNIWKQWNPVENQNKLEWEEFIDELQTTKRTKETNGKRNKAV